jgi:hypothetical protein
MLEVDHLNELADEYNREGEATPVPTRPMCPSASPFVGLCSPAVGIGSGICWNVHKCTIVLRLASLAAAVSGCTFENGVLQSLSAPRRTDVRSLAQLACDLDVCDAQDSVLVSALVDLSKRLRADAVSEWDLRRETLEVSSASQEARDTARQFRKCVTVDVFLSFDAAAARRECFGCLLDPVCPW